MSATQEPGQEPSPTPALDDASGPDAYHLDSDKLASPSYEYTATSAESDGYASSLPPTPSIHARTPSLSASSSHQDQEDLEALPPLDRLTIFDFLENLALPQRLERLQNSLSAQTEKVRRQRQKLSLNAKQKVVEEWRKRVPPPDEQLTKYRKSMRSSVERLGKKWGDAKTVTTKEKVAFIAGVLNIFISGYLVGAFPEYFHLWYTAQLCYFYPIRFWTYKQRGYHYFLVDLCYFVNLLLVLSIWVAPQSKRLFISTFCLAFGNNAVAIAMWRNSLVFHSLDKVTSLFIHIMPCVTLHCLVHLIPPSLQASRFPAIHHIKTSSPDSPEHYSLASMVVWATVPYATWQLSYHLFITVRRRDKIAAGRPTSFTWLRKSYSKTMIGRFVLSLPETLQEPAFMFIQYVYALLTMMPAPIWFWFRWPSACFLMVVFTWSVYNGAVYYIDIFGTRFQKDLDRLKADVARWQMSPDLAGKTPLQTPGVMTAGGSTIETSNPMDYLNLGAAAVSAAPEASSEESYSIVEKNSAGADSTTSTTGSDSRQADAAAGLRNRP